MNPFADPMWAKIVRAWNTEAGHWSGSLRGGRLAAGYYALLERVIAGEEPDDLMFMGHSIAELRHVMPDEMGWLVAAVQAQALDDATPKTPFVKKGERL